MKTLNPFVRQYLNGAVSSLVEFFAGLRRERLKAGNMQRDTGAERFLGTLEDGPVWDAPERMQAESKRFFTTETYLRQMGRADWRETDLQIQEFASRFVLEMRKLRIPFFVHCALRTPAEQLEMVRKGVSRAYPKEAPHVRGGAVDIVHSRFAWDLTPDEWEFVGRVGKDIARRMGINIEWGGDWNFYDPAHWQIAEWRDLDMPPHPIPGVPKRLTPSAIKSRGYTFKSGYTGKRQVS